MAKWTYNCYKTLQEANCVLESVNTCKELYYRLNCVVCIEGLMKNFCPRKKIKHRKGVGKK